MAKNDEFYTLLPDIEAELKYYDFTDKIVYCPCDDFTWSNFAVYFSQNFARLKLKKLICSCYYPEQTHFFEPYKRGFWVEFNGKKWSQKHYFENGNGDFRSAECTALKRQADCIVTNPPFSIFTDFFFWVLEKPFLCVFPQTAITQRRIFPYFAKGDVWLGKSIRTHGRLFRVPDYFHIRNFHHSRVRDGVKFCEVDSARWVTNMRKFKEKDLLLTESYTPEHYPKFDNYNAINVDKKGEIPCDYFGAMGVPACFFNYYNPEQFEILDCKHDLCVNGKAKNVRIIIKRRVKQIKNTFF